MANYCKPSATPPQDKQSQALVAAVNRHMPATPRGKDAHVSNAAAQHILQGTELEAIETAVKSNFRQVAHFGGRGGQWRQNSMFRTERSSTPFG
jgi:hypothetical protein